VTPNFLFYCRRVEAATDLKLKKAAIAFQYSCGYVVASDKLDICEVCNLTPMPRDDFFGRSSL
jgi:hypothetical protein